MIYRKVVFMATAAVALVSLQSPTVAAPLIEELSDLVANHPLIQSNRFQVKSAEQNVRAAFSPYLPQLDLTADAGQQRVSTAALRSTPDGPLESGTETWGLSLTLNVYDGG
ncbi:MAG: TolC family protein, partial [Rhodospirillaceae bacterium]